MGYLVQIFQILPVQSSPGGTVAALFNLDERSATADITPEDLHASLNAMPVASQLRLVIVTNGEKLSKATKDMLVQYLKDPNPYCTFCLACETLAKSTLLYKAIQKLGTTSIIDCSAKKRWELPEYVMKLSNSYGVSIERTAAEELITRLGESTLMLDTKLKVLAQLCRQKGSISKSDVEEYVVRITEVKPWEFADAISERDLEKTMRLYSMMEQPAPIAVLSWITIRIRELTIAQALQARGEGRLIAQTLSKQDWQIKNYSRYIQKFSERELFEILAVCARCEKALKTGAMGDIVLIDLFVFICQGS